MREVESAAEEIARLRGNEEFYIPMSRLSDFETKGVIPSIYRMYTLSVIYRMDPRKVFALYDVPFDFGPRDALHSKRHVEHREVRDRSRRNATPPVVGCFLLDLLLPKKHRENLIGDIEQDFTTNILPRYGRTAASIWFWKQVIAEIIPGLYLRIFASFVKHFFSRVH
jgi:hypothetical protein